ncbi:MAG: hypothetical protein AAGF54_18035 [Pseudomonadota bacterium]
MPDSRDLSINRLVLNFPGFETTTPVHQLERLLAGGEKTAKLWGYDFSPAEISDKRGEYKAEIQCRSSGENWVADTRYVHFSWDDIIGKYENMPYPKSFFRHLPAYLSFFFDGSVIKYFKASKRYWGFTIYPLLLMVLFAVISFGLAFFALGQVSIILSILSGFIGFLILCKWPGDQFYVNLSVNDWAFARDMCRRSNPEIEKRYEEFSNHVIHELENSNVDEVLIVGHSFGSVWAVAALAYALEQKPDLFSGKRVTFLALGSSFLKISLVKEARHFSEFLETVLSKPELLWHEIQTKTDFISFYKSDPFKPLGIVEFAAELVVHRVNFKKALSKVRHKKMMRSMYLAHRQYILYCDKRVHHDFQLRCFGPLFAKDLAINPGIIDTSRHLNQADG